MNIGMLWFDNDNNSDLPTKVNRAANYYHGKYGIHPNLCFIHPSMATILGTEKSQPKQITSGNIEIRLTKSVLPHHFWIGVDEKNAELVR
jgi:hypothetical protein